MWMNKILQHKQKVFVTILGVLLLSSSIFSGLASATAPTCYFNPLSGSYNVGTEISLNLHMYAPGPYSNMITNYTVGSGLGFVSYTMASGGSGNVTLVSGSEYRASYYSDTPINGNTVFANITFEILGSGSATLTMNSAEEKSSTQEVYTSVSTQNASFTAIHPKPPPTGSGTTTPPPKTTTPPPSTGTPPGSSKPTTKSTTQSSSSSSSGSRTPLQVIAPKTSTTPTTTGSNTSSTYSNANTINPGTTSGSTTKIKPTSKGDSGLWALILIPLAAFVIFILIRRRRIPNAEAYTIDSGMTLPTPQAETIKDETNVSQEPYSTEPVDEDPISESIDRAFYPLRYQKEQEQKHKEDNQ
jgi:hypothetical protein